MDKVKRLTNKLTASVCTAAAILSLIAVQVLSVSAYAYQNSALQINSQIVTYEDDGSAWKQAYIEYVTKESLAAEGTMEADPLYILVYIDEDEIPELLDVSPSDLIGSRLVCFDKFSLKYKVLNVNIYHDFHVLKGGNYIRDSYKGMGWTFENVYYFKNSELSVVAECEYISDESLRDKYEGGDQFFTVNGKNSTRDNFEANLNKIFNSSGIDNYQGKDYNESDLLFYLRS